MNPDQLIDEAAKASTVAAEARNAADTRAKELTQHHKQSANTAQRMRKELRKLRAEQRRTAKEAEKAKAAAEAAARATATTATTLTPVAPADTTPPVAPDEDRNVNPNPPATGERTDTPVETGAAVPA